MAINPEIKNSPKAALNSYLPLFAKEIPGLIDQWRAEISQQKRYRANIKPAKLREFLADAEVHGVPAALVVLTVLCCEWTFRIRRPTEEDIERELAQMESNLSKSIHGALTPFQAKLLVKLLERGLRKEMRNVRIPVIFGFATGRSHLGWALFMRGEVQSKRVPYKHVVRTRRGRIPILGPIIAGVIVGALFEEHVGEDAWKFGRKLSEVLLNTRVLAPRFRGWQQTFSNAWATLSTPRARFTERMKGAYDQIFKMPREAMSPEAFLEACKREPISVIGWLAQEDVLEVIYSQKWADSKTS